MRRIGHAYISHHPRRRAVAQAARFSTSINRPAQPSQRPKPNNAPQSANLDAATPPREGRRSRPIPGTGTTPPRGILGLGPVSLTLVMLVLSGLGWFGYRYYRLSTIYPAPIRAALRVGLAAMLKQEYDQAEIAFRRALELAYATPPSELSPDPHIKLTGIAVKLGEALELSGKKPSALHVYIQTLGELFPQFDVYKDDENNRHMTFNKDGTLDKEFRRDRKHPDWKHVPLGGKSRLRAVGLANRAAMLAEGLQNTNTLPPAATSTEWTKSWNAMELYLRTFSVMQILYLASNTTGIPTSELSTSPELDSKLPKWLNRLDLAAPCEGLADYYVRNKNISLALPLYQTTYHFLLPTTTTSTASNDSTISTTTPLATVSYTPSDPTMMCMAAQVLTAMSAAVMGLDSPRRLMGSSPPGSSTTSEKSNGDEAPSANIKAVRSWARESRRLVDLGRRVHGKADYLHLMNGVEVLGREEPSSKSKSQPQAIDGNDDEEGLDKDERLVRLDLKRIQEGNRRWKEAAFKQQVNSIGMRSPTAQGNDGDRESAAVQVGKWGDDPWLKGNTICERTWAVVLYNTGMVEAVDGNTSIAEQYLQLALEQSRRINLLEGVQKSKAALRDLVSGSNRR